MEKVMDPLEKPHPGVSKSDMLELRVKQLTAQLQKTNDKLTHEIEKRRRTEKEMVENRSKFLTILNNVPVMIILVDSDRRVLEANQAALAFASRPESEVIGVRGGEALGCLHALDDPQGCGFGENCQTCVVRSTVISTLQTGRSYRNVDGTLAHKKGKMDGKFHILLSTVPLAVLGHDMVVVCIQDITQLKQAEAEIKEREATLNAILSASPIGIGLVHNRVLGWTNRAMYRVWGYEMDSLLGKNTKILYPDADEYERVGRDFYAEIEQTGLGKIETQWLTKNGRIIHCHLQGCQLDAADPSKGIIVAAMDITDRKNSENLVHDLSQMLIETQENERQMISYELHDCIAQNLSSLKIDCDTFFLNQPAPSHELKEKMTKQSRLIEQTIKAVRDLSYGLHPPSLDQMGIVTAISHLCEDFSEQTGLTVSFIPSGMDGLKPVHSLEINLYRLVQEGLNNIKKHADADHVEIKLIASHPNIILRIEDNGKGFDVAARRAESHGKKKLGLRSMEERVALLNGVMKIKSNPNQGTKIFIKIP